MTFCIKCGNKVPKDAEFCSKCGTRVGAFTKPEKTDYSGIGGTLILVGGILSIVFSIAPLAFTLFWRSLIKTWVNMPIMWERWGDMDAQWTLPLAMSNWILGFIIVSAVISIILGIVAIYAYKKVRGDEIKTGSTIAIILGVLMLVTMSWLPGIITIIGGILCYTSK